MSIDLTEAIEAVVMETACTGDLKCPGCHRDAERWIKAALPHIEKQIRHQIAAEIENRASQPRMEDSAPQWSVAKLQRDAYINGLSRAAQIARKENTNA